MYYVDRSIRTPEQAQQFVQICEQNFELRLNQLVHSLVYDAHPEVITLSGPTCSGKTTTARKLTEEITAAGKNAMVLSIDDFFRDRALLMTSGETPDFDSVAAIDLDLLASCMETMLKGCRTRLPRYDFKTGKRSEYYEYVNTPDDIIILEGIQAVYPEVTELLSEYPYKSIFINVTDGIIVNGVEFSRTDVRLARRIVRDYRFRNASPEFTLDIWQSVRENEEKNIFPYMSGCDYVINSLQPYELFMIGPYALPLLESVPAGNPRADEAQQLAERFRMLRGNEIDPKYLSENSLYHEFLG